MNARRKADVTRSLPATTWVCIVLVLAQGQDLAAAPKGRIDPDGIRGSLLICGGGDLPEEIHERFVNLAGRKRGRLVLIPTAANDSQLNDPARLIEPWLKYEFTSVDVLHTRDRDEANRPDFVEKLRAATAVWIGGGQQSRLAQAYSGTAVERELQDLLGRGGVIGGTSAGAAIQSQRMIAGGNPVPQMETGLDLLPQSIVDQHFRQRQREPRLRHALAHHPGLVGFGVDERTALVVHGRHLEVVGDERVTVLLSPCAWRKETELVLEDGDRADLTTLRRAAAQRLEKPVVPPKIDSVAVPQGTLFIAGGGRLPRPLLQRFLELAGGSEARIVVLPTASEERVPDGDSERRMFELSGAKQVTVLAGRSVAEVESEENLAALREATGIWFGGGRQWRFVDAYEGTKAVELFHQVLARGGVIGGSSAGASIQAEYLVRGSPLGNREMMAEGYERGFRFFPGTAIDQHFTQRQRHGDMKSLIATYPQLLGIGIDESTVLIVRGSTAEVHGEHSVYFFDGARGEGSPIQVPAGKRFNLATRAAE